MNGSERKNTPVSGEKYRIEKAGNKCKRKRRKEGGDWKTVIISFTHFVSGSNSIKLLMTSFPKETEVIRDGEKKYTHT